MDKKLDIFRDITVDTYRSGRFYFQIGLDRSVIEPLIERVKDAHRVFADVPLLPQIAKELEQEVMVSSVFGTDTIEGGALSEQEISEIFAENLPIEEITDENERRVVNLKRTYEYVDQLIQNQDGVVEGRKGVSFRLSEPLIIQLHKLITDGLTHQKYAPGQYRHNPKDSRTQVGNPDHGGIYTPPRCFEDIQTLMRNFIQWINSDYMLEQPPLIRAPLAHYYFERIHPFYDGNGRVGRMIETLLLKSSGMMYAHHALAKVYLEHIDEYFLVFNTSRKREKKDRANANTPFVEFFLNCIREVFYKLHARVNVLIGIVLYENSVSSYHREKKINDRQHTIINNLLPKGNDHTLSDIQSMTWYTGMYKNLTRKTRDRDLRKLVELRLVSIKDKNLKLLVP